MEIKKRKEEALLKSKKAKMRILEMKKKKMEIEKKLPKTLLNTQGSHERIKKGLKANYKTLSLKRKKKEVRGLGVKVIKAEMNSVSKRADYLCRVSIFKTTKSTKVVRPSNRKPSYPVSRTVYWEENLVFDIDEILTDGKQHSFANKNSTSKILKTEKPKQGEEEEGATPNLLVKPEPKKLQKQVSFQVKSVYQKFQEIKEEFIYFNVYEYYDQGEEIFLCSSKISIADIMKRTNRFLFNLLVNDKKLGQLKIGKGHQSSTTGSSKSATGARSTSRWTGPASAKRPPASNPTRTGCACADSLLQGRPKQTYRR